MNSIKNIIVIAIIFITYIIVYNYFNSIDEMLRNWQINQELKRNLVTPFLFSILFIFLRKRGFGRIALSSYIIFILLIFAEQQIVSVSLQHNVILVYAALMISVTFIFVLVYQLLPQYRRIATIINSILSLLIYIIPLMFIIYILNSGAIVSAQTIHAILQSNVVESFEYVSNFVSTKYLLLFIFTLIVLNFIIYKQSKQNFLAINKLFLVVMIIIFLSVFVSKMHKLSIYKLVITGSTQYQNNLDLFKEIQSKRNAIHISYTATKDNAKGETYIVIIGESLNKQHMGIYGYLRNTTPMLSELKKNKLIVFNNAYSSHTHTMETMKLSLTQANQYNNKKYYNSLSIIDILQKSDISTYWLTNQSMYGIFDNLVSVIATTANTLIVTSNTTQRYSYDEALINEVKKILATKSNNNRVIFVHLMGNHSAYHLRYPKKYAIYKTLKHGEFGKSAAKVKAINKYDNSVAYNDYVVGTIIKEIQKQKGINGVVYLSDHADDVVKNLGHDVGRFTYEMSQIPMLAWFSKDYQTKYINKYTNFINNTEKLFSNDMLYDTLIGLFGIKTNQHNSKYDLTSKNYNINEENALILDGNNLYANSDNHIYWQQKNTQYLLDTYQSVRIFPHRVNSIGKLKNIWHNGFRAFEIDVRFNNKTNIFEVGHNNGDMGLSLDDFLNKTNYLAIKKIWLDFKNLNASNHKNALLRLQYLNQKYHLKEKIIIESQTDLPLFKLFKKEKWHTSYYLPTTKIIKLLANKNKRAMKKLSQKLIKQIAQQNLSAISFDDRLYLFVKQYVEPYISNNIVYHAWYAPDLKNHNFSNELLKNKLYLDKRVKTLLTPYQSDFNL